VSVDLRTDDPETRFAAGAVLSTEPATAGPLTVAAVRPHSGRLLVTFEGVADRGAAESLRGVRLVADVDVEARSGDPDEYYDSQLEGLAVRTVAGEPVGTVAAVLHLPGHELLSVRREDGTEVLVPFVAAIVVSVDLPGSALVLDPPAGLLDPDQADTDDVRT
jgi:16S rRNA processing protein RimM